MAFSDFLFSSDTTHPQVRVYHSYGDNDRCFVMGHVFEDAPARSPEDAVRPAKKQNYLQNALDMLRLFRVKPVAGVAVEVAFTGGTIQGKTNQQGFFFMEFSGNTQHVAGWNPVDVTVISGKLKGLSGTGKIYHSHGYKQGFISDIDDTFLVSHSSDLWNRMRVVLTKSPATRKPFKGVVAHYQALSLFGASSDLPNPFFYVSSSEWNLYDYIKDFCRFHKLPEGVFLLSDLKRLSSFIKTGQNNHLTKYRRIARILNEYPETRFALLGDDTQKDPAIYLKAVQSHPGQINAVYIRKRNPENREAVRAILQEIGKMGIPVSYFKHSREALEHSRKIGLA